MSLDARISQLESSGLGLERIGGVRLASHNSRWQREFSEEAHRIFETLKIPELQIFHVGSTSIPGLHAKPIIDILIATPSLSTWDARQSNLELLGYECKGEYGIAGRRYCVLYDSQKTKGYVHLHAFEKGHPEIETHLLFRDYLRRCSEDCRQYEALKLKLAHQQGVPRSDYSALKAPLIRDIMERAALWKKNFRPTALALLGSAEGGSKTEAALRAEFDHLELVRLQDRRISPYRYDGDYPQGDEFFHLVGTILEADTLILASPVYWYAISGAMKTFLDRFSDLISAHKEMGRRLYGKNIRFFSTGSDAEPPIGLDVPVNLTAIYFGMDYQGMIYKCTGGAE